MITKLIKKFIIINSLPYSELIQKCNKPAGVDRDIMTLQLFRAEIAELEKQLTGTPAKNDFLQEVNKLTEEIFYKLDLES